MYELVHTSYFDRQLRRFQRAHPQLQTRLAQVLRELAEDPFQPHLRLHPLGGQMEGLHAARITYAHRLILTLRITDKAITLLDIGTHDEVYR